MTITNGCVDIHTSVLIGECYGKFNSFRVAKLGMQIITDAFQFVAHERKICVVNYL